MAVIIILIKYVICTYAERLAESLVKFNTIYFILVILEWL